jgi:hypothetical protein
MNEISNIRIINNIHKELSESIRHLLIKNYNIPKGNKIKNINNKNKKLDDKIFRLNPIKKILMKILLTIKQIKI